MQKKTSMNFDLYAKFFYEFLNLTKNSHKLFILYKNTLQISKLHQKRHLPLVTVFFQCQSCAFSHVTLRFNSDSLLSLSFYAQ